MGLGMEIYESFTYAMFALDLLDAGLDYGFVAELAKNSDTVNHAVWLAICTTIALGMEVVVKIAIQRRKRVETLEGSTTSTEENYNTKSKTGRATFIVFCSVTELMIFFIEDSSTLFVWWQTGLYLDNREEASGLSKANLYITVSSAVFAVITLVYGMYRFARDNSQGGEGECETDMGAIILFYIPVGMVCAVLTFWAWFSLKIILAGGSYNCIGACQTNSELIAADVARAAAFDQFAASDGGGLTRRGADDDLLYSAVATLLDRSAEFSEETKLVLSQLQSSFGLNQSTLEQFELSPLDTTSLYSTTDNTTMHFDFEDSGSGFGESLAVGSYADDKSLNRSVVGLYVIGWILAVFGAGMTIMQTFCR
eukprot:gene10287-11802_t